MNAIASTIKAVQDTEAAKKATAAAQDALQAEIYYEARARVACLIREFNEMPMELRETHDGHAGGNRPLDYVACGNNKDYSRLGKGLRFFFVWAPDGRNLCVTLNDACRFAYTSAFGPITNELVKKREESHELLTLDQVEAIFKVDTRVTDDSKFYKIVGHITRDGRFAVGSTNYDDKERDEFVCPNPASWFHRILSSPDITPYIMFPAAPTPVAKKRGKGSKA